MRVTNLTHDWPCTFCNKSGGFLVKGSQIGDIIVCNPCAAELAKQLVEKPVEMLPWVEQRRGTGPNGPWLAVRINQDPTCPWIFVNRPYHDCLRRDCDVMANSGELFDPAATLARLAELERLNDEQAARLTEQDQQLDRLEKENQQLAGTCAEFRSLDPPPYDGNGAMRDAWIMRTLHQLAQRAGAGE